jgi:hypothetical protein
LVSVEVQTIYPSSLHASTLYDKVETVVLDFEYEPVSVVEQSKRAIWFPVKDPSIHPNRGVVESTL